MQDNNKSIYPTGALLKCLCIVLLIVLFGTMVGQYYTTNKKVLTFDAFVDGLADLPKLDQDELLYDSNTLSKSLLDTLKFWQRYRLPVDPDADIITKYFYKVLQDIYDTSLDILYDLTDDLSDFIDFVYLPLNLSSWRISQIRQLYIYFKYIFEFFFK